MSDRELVESLRGGSGERSPRRFTLTELRAAQRLGLAERSSQFDPYPEVVEGWRGPMFWAGGSSVPDEVRQTAKDAALVLAAIEREWEVSDVE